MRITWNGSAIAARALEAFRDTNRLLEREIVQQISSDKWQWTDGKLRDVVDTGRLRAAQSLSFSAPNVAAHSSSTEYSLAVHEGARFRNGTAFPARPFMTEAVNELDLAATFARLYRGSP